MVFFIRNGNVTFANICLVIAKSQTKKKKNLIFMKNKSGTYALMNRGDTG